MLYSDAAGRLQLARERAEQLARDYGRKDQPDTATVAQHTRESRARRVLALRRESHESARA